MIDFPALGAYAFVMSITPGPNNVMLTASGVAHGYRRSLPHLCGISLGCALQTALAAWGVGAMFERLPQARLWLGWIGAAYLLWVACMLLRSSGVAEANSARPMRAWEAALFQFINPKAWMMTITIGVMFLPHGEAFGPALALVIALFVAVNFACISAWAAFGSLMRRHLADPRRRLVFNGTMAALLLGSGVMMVAG